ncbi:MAG: hypothetical protein J1E40_08875 [Oscillospiraceae bacterium]|nr:hypothetical protein [Oscillospiraceae bacterium]
MLIPKILADTFENKSGEQSFSGKIVPQQEYRNPLTDKGMTAAVQAVTNL